MKKFFILCLLFSVSLLNYAQSELLIKDGNNNIINDQTIYVVGDIDVLYKSAEIILAIQNTSANDLSVKIRKEEIDLVSGTTSEFCWDEFCDPPFLNVSSHSYVISAGETTPELKKLHAFYNAVGNSGASTIKYYAFVEGTSIESSVTVIYMVFHTSLTPKETEQPLIFPNPATDLFYIDGSQLNSAKVRVEVYNMIGRKVNEFQFGQAEKQTVDCSAWDKGVYILRIYSDGNLVKSTKITKK